MSAVFFVVSSERVGLGVLQITFWLSVSLYLLFLPFLRFQVDLNKFFAPFLRLIESPKSRV